MTLVVIAGLGVGMALIGIWQATRPTRRSAVGIIRSMELATSNRRPPGTARGRTASGRPVDGCADGRDPKSSLLVRARVDRMVGDKLAEALEGTTLSQDPNGPLREVLGWLRATSTPLRVLCGEAVLAGFAGMAVPLFAMAFSSAAGVHLPALAVALVTPVLGVGAGLLPLLSLRHKAEQMRRDARAVIASFLDLVVLGLAGGMGIEGALHAASGVSDDPMAERLRSALDLARDSGDTPWRALAGLGAELGIDELTELAAAVGLAGREGARVRATLAAKAGSIRRHQLAEAEAEANRLTERLFFPGAFLLLGFLLFLGYPAVARILGGF